MTENSHVDVRGIDEPVRSFELCTEACVVRCWHSLNSIVLAAKMYEDLVW